MVRPLDPLPTNASFLRESLPARLPVLHATSVHRDDARRAAYLPSLTGRQGEAVGASDPRRFLGPLSFCLLLSSSLPSLAWVRDSLAK